ncbi:MAG: hypothetical protein PHU44_11445 [Syntrophales bacterium]|nr:hypothetical protein [Syntrophales bacterium]
MNVMLAFFLGLFSGGLGGIFLIGLVFLLREGLQEAKMLKNQSNFKQLGGSPAPELWEMLRPVPRLSGPGRVSGQISKSYDCQVLVPFRRMNKEYCGSRRAQAPLKP